MISHAYYEKGHTKFAHITESYGRLSAERRRIRKSGLPKNQKRQILDYLANVSANRYVHAVRQSSS